MNDDLTFGHTWEDIQRAQRGGSLHKTIDTSAPLPIPTPTDADRDLLAKYGSTDALEAAGFFGSADRLRQEDQA